MLAVKCREVFNGIPCPGLCLPLLPFPDSFPCSLYKCSSILVEYSCSICHKSFNSLDSDDDYPLFHGYEGLQNYLNQSSGELNINTLKKHITQLDKVYPSRNPELLIARVLLLRYYVNSEVRVVCVDEVGELSSFS